MSAVSCPPASCPPALEGTVARRFLHLWIPRLSTDRVRLERPSLAAETPLATFVRAKSALRLAVVDAAAAALGLAPGLTLKDARRIAPALVTVAHDPSADAVLRRRLLERCRRFTPTLAEAPDGLTLEVTGAGALFGGEAALLAQVQAALAQAGVEARPGLADTPSLAWTLARFAGQPVCPPGEARERLAPLPVEALRRPGDEGAGLVEDLEGLGLRRIGDALAWPRDQLSEAVGEALWLRLDELLGRRDCALCTVLEPRRFVAERRLMEAVCGAPALLHHVRRLAEAVRDQLLRHGQGGRGFRLTLFGAGGLVRRFEVGARTPLTDPAEITALFARRLEAVGTGADAADDRGATDDAFEQFRLEARSVEPLPAQTGDLLGEAGQATFDQLVASLQARFGPDVIERVVQEPRSAKPEIEWGFAPVDAPPRAGGQGPAPPPPAWGDAVLRPLRLFRPAQPIEVITQANERPPFTFVWRRRRHVVVRAEGPERLSPEWAREDEGARTRDYYRVEDDTGHRFWLYREGFYEEGAHGERPGPPRWYLHGLFA